MAKETTFRPIIFLYQKSQTCTCSVWSGNTNTQENSIEGIQYIDDGDIGAGNNQTREVQTTYYQHICPFMTKRREVRDSFFEKLEDTINKILRKQNYFGWKILSRPKIQ